MRFLALVLAAVIGGTIAGIALELQAAALIAGVTAVLTLVACTGHALRSDLRRCFAVGPVIVLVMASGPWLASMPLLGGCAVALVVFAAGLLPGFGEKYRAAAQALAAAVLVAVTTGIGTTGFPTAELDTTTQSPPWIALLAAAGIGGGFGLVLRILLGLSDPTRPTRIAVARALVEPGPGVIEQAAAAWRADGSPQWLGVVLAGAARFRAARQALLVQAERMSQSQHDLLRMLVDQADLVAEELARAVRAKRCNGLPLLARSNPTEMLLRRQHVGARAELPPSPSGLPWEESDLPHAAIVLNRGLARVRDAVTDRDKSTVAKPVAGSQLQWLRSVLLAHCTPASSLFRHALRCTLAVILGYVIMWSTQDIAAAALVLSLYYVLQPAARDSMTGALERTGAVVLGVVALAATMAILTSVGVPTSLIFLPVLIVVMVLSVDRLRLDNRWLLAGLIALTVMDRTMYVQRPVANVAVSFAAHTAIGAAAALIIGFISYAVLPSHVARNPGGAVRQTARAVADWLGCVREGILGADVRSRLATVHARALRQTQDLQGLPAVLDRPEVEVHEREIVTAAARALNALRADVQLLAFRPEQEQVATEPVLRVVEHLLGSRMRAQIPDMPVNGTPMAELLGCALVENALYARAGIDQSTLQETPWQHFRISFTPALAG